MFTKTETVQAQKSTEKKAPKLVKGTKKQQAPLPCKPMYSV